KYPGLNLIGDHREIMGDPAIEAVVVATPGATHHRLVMEALAAGKDVYVEKPMALSAQDCREIVAKAQAEERIVMVGHLLLYHPAVVKMKEELDAGNLGDPYYLSAQRLNLGKIRRSENALWTFAPHDISVALHLIGAEPVSVSAWGESYVQPEVEDVVFARIAFPGKVMAHIHVSWLDPHKVRKITLVGSRKMMVFDDMDKNAPLRIYDKGVPEDLEYDSYGEYLTLRYGDEYVPAVRAGEPLGLECAHFVECVRERRFPLTDGRNGLRAVRVLEAAQESLRRGGKVIALNEER
ncbi:MAG TPA: Gfo/Idh/MocA family oxidoreductase, partial [bacterium]|nr:Gfo/Idh/MocA family oxidoreductase [bacterium]